MNHAADMIANFLTGAKIKNNHYRLGKDKKAHQALAG